MYIETDGGLFVGRSNAGSTKKRGGVSDDGDDILLGFLNLRVRNVGNKVGKEGVGGWLGEKGECGKHTLWQHTHRDGIVGGGLGVLGDQI